jgi:hypothetical protein
MTAEILLLLILLVLVVAIAPKVVGFICKTFIALCAFVGICMLTISILS